MQDHEYCGNYGYGRNADRDKGFAGSDVRSQALH
ncbi:hypothetical protein PMI11_05429 [Rhizobium sp. CF142]|nr:hypothetical protein PMI11_05429 [Rhizobium sp. CF142]